MPGRENGELKVNEAAEAAAQSQVATTALSADEISPMIELTSQPSKTQTTSTESKDGVKKVQATATESTTQPPAVAKQYSVFSRGEKTLIIAAGSLAAFFSPLTSSIYLPALNTIAEALHVSDSRINLTVTTYLILQGVAPMMIAGFSDNMGRRPAYVLCFTIYLAANLGLGLQNSYVALLVLRCLQSAGSSGTVALSNGLVGDLVTSEQRGQFIAMASLGGLLGPTVSPIIGGAISESLDWHWIFWFLLIFAAVFCVPLFLFLPETCRAIVGDGSIPPPPLNWSMTDVIRHRRRERRGVTFDQEERARLHQNYRIRFPNPLPTLRILYDLESVVVLIGTGVGFACLYAIMTGAAASLHQQYHFGNLQIALMFIPIGVGGIISALTTGRLLDWNYRRHARKQGVTIVKGVHQDLADFPIEEARMEICLPLMLLSAVFVIGYGWTMEQHVSLAAPVIFLFLFGYTSIATYQSLNVLMMDIWPGKSAAATAANNFVRCELGAGATAAIEPMSQAMGRGWAYTTLGLIYVAVAPLTLVIMRRGLQMRRTKREREAQKNAEQEHGR